MSYEEILNRIESDGTILDKEAFKKFFGIDIVDAAMATPEPPQHHGIRDMKWGVHRANILPDYAIADINLTNNMINIGSNMNFTSYNNCDIRPEIFVDKVPAYEVLELRSHTVEAVARLLKASSWKITPPKAKKRTKKEIKKGLPTRFTPLKVTYYYGDEERTVKAGEFVVVGDDGFVLVLTRELFYATFERKIVR